MPDYPDYDFTPFRASLGGNWYLEDELLRRILDRVAPDATRAFEATLVDFGERAAGLYHELADQIERPEKLPYIARKDPYDRRCDHVVLPPETRRMLAEAKSGDSGEARKISRDELGILHDWRVIGPQRVDSYRSVDSVR